jgi:adenine-specific DNA-methyltransferase
MAEKLKMSNKGILSENIEFIESRFPNAVTEVIVDGKLVKKVEFEILKQELSNSLIDEKQERYQMTWPDKKKAILDTNSQTTKTLRPSKEKSTDFESTKNIYIEGENLDVLKVIRETYTNSVKLIYIDPPYNTGNDYVYSDKFLIEGSEYQLRSGEIDHEGNRLYINNLSNGRIHTDWINMIYPRLKIAKDLLSDDGVIFISIDHHEVLNLSKICDEIFGPTNRLGILSVINNMKGRSDDKFFATCNEFLLVYSKNINSFEIGGFKLDEEEIENDYEKQDDIGFYKLIGFRKTGTGWEREARPHMYYPVLFKGNNFTTISDEEFKNIYNQSTNKFNDEYVSLLITKYSQLGYKVILPLSEKKEFGRWRWGRETFMEQKDLNLEINNSGTLCTKMRATIEDGSIRVKTAKTFWYKPEYDTGSSSKVLKNLFNSNEVYFDNPKSTVLLKDILKISTKKDSIVLDFFSGSGTTAHALMELNAEDNGNRKFIIVQVREEYDKNSKAFLKGYKTICDFAQERIKKVGQKIKGEIGLSNRKFDSGFRVLTLDSSNMKDTYHNPSKVNQVLIDEFVTNIKNDRNGIDLLFQVMLNLGIELSAKIEEKKINGKDIFVVNESYLVACFDSELDGDTIKEIAKSKPIYAVFRDSCFSNDSANINCEQLIKSISPSTELKVL